MDWLVAPGILVTFAGIGLLMWCIFRVWDAKRKGADDEALRAVLQSVMPWNLGAMGISAIGLMMVVVGLML